MIEILSSISQAQDFDLQLIKAIKKVFASNKTKNPFKNEIQANILLLIRGIYRVKANEEDLNIGVEEISKSFWNNSMQTTLFQLISTQFLKYWFNII